MGLTNSILTKTELTETELIDILSEILLSLNFEINENFKVTTYLDIAELLIKHDNINIRSDENLNISNVLTCNASTLRINKNTNRHLLCLLLDLMVNYIYCRKEIQISHIWLHHYNIDHEGINFFKRIYKNAKTKLAYEYLKFTDTIDNFFCVANSKIMNEFNKISNNESDVKNIINTFHSEMKNSIDLEFEKKKEKHFHFH